MKTLKIYLAGPLFSLGQREFNNRIVTAIRMRIPMLDFIVPQEYATKINNKEGFLIEVFSYCIKSIGEADALLCVLDGPDVDSGTCIEMGYAYAHKKPIIGIRTDFRSLEDKGGNLMVSNVCDEMIWLPSSHVTENQVIDEIIDVLKRIFKL